MAWFDMDYAYRKSITIPQANVSGAAALTNFDWFFRVMGDAEIAALALASGFDIRFTFGEDVEIPYDRVSHTGAGNMHYHVNSTLQPLSDTEHYVYFGFPAAADGENAPAVWPNYDATWHYTAGSPPDATGNGNNLTMGPNGTTPAPGQLHLGRWFNRDGANIRYMDVTVNTIFSNTAEFTFSYWFYQSVADQAAMGLTNGMVIDNYDVPLAAAGMMQDIGWRPFPPPADYRPSGNVVTTGGGVAFPIPFNPAGNITTDNWHCLQGRYSVAQGNARVLLDGVQIGLAAIVPGATLIPWNVARVGNYQSAPPVAGAGQYSGRLEYMKWSNVEFTDDWLYTQWLNQSNPEAFYVLGPLERRPGIGPFESTPFVPPYDSPFR